MVLTTTLSLGPFKFLIGGHAGRGGIVSLNSKLGPMVPVAVLSL
jgi:hypothetical protein